MLAIGISLHFFLICIYNGCIENLKLGLINAQLGGPDGKIVIVKAGDVIVIPAGVAHKNIDQSPDCKVVGAYPTGQIPDMKYGKPGERPMTDENIRKVPLPANDPVFGKARPLIQHWGGEPIGNKGLRLK